MRFLLFDDKASMVLGRRVPVGLWKARVDQRGFVCSEDLARTSESVISRRSTAGARTVPLDEVMFVLVREVHV